LVKGERTAVYWVGFVLFGFSLFVLLTTIWEIVFDIYFYSVSSDVFSTSSSLKFTLIAGEVPLLILGIIFLAMGLYMMKEGVRKNQSPLTQPAQTQKAM
jgi:hypothetical protein